MAEISPFRALYYSPKKTSGLDTVVTQPYDKISREMQDRYYAAHPNNLVRIVFGKTGPEFDSITVTVKAFVALNCGEPLSVTRVVNVFTVPPKPSPGVHEMIP